MRDFIREFFQQTETEGDENKNVIGFVHLGGKDKWI